jgi:hypothetical protein
METDGDVVFGIDAVTSLDDGKPVPLLVLALGGNAFIVRLEDLTAGVPPALYRLLADRRIPKAGRGISKCVVRLQQGYGLVTRGCVELRDVLTGLGRADLAKQGVVSVIEHLVGYDNKASIEALEHNEGWAIGDLPVCDVRMATINAWAAKCSVMCLYNEYKGKMGPEQFPTVSTFASFALGKARKAGRR